MTEILVWVDEWQWACCGERFDVGEEVDWLARAPDRAWLADVLGSSLASAVDYAEDHHNYDGSVVVSLRGRVMRIRRAMDDPAPRDGAAYSPGTRPLVDADTAFEDLSPDGSAPSTFYCGMLVELELYQPPTPV